MSRLSLYKAFENYEYVHKDYLNEIQNYICGNLNSWSPNRSYWYEQYNICTKLYHVCKWRKGKGFQPIGKKGENICNDKLVNIFAEHKDCVCAVV